MEEIFANPGLQLVAEKICQSLSPREYQSLILTSKLFMNYSARTFQMRLVKCKQANMCTDEEWDRLVNLAQNNEMVWILGIIFKFIYDNKDSKLHYTQNLIKNSLQTVSFLGHSKLLKLLLEKDKRLTHFNNFKKTKNFYRSCIAKTITLQGKHGKTETFKAYYNILKLFVKYDKPHLNNLLPLARNSSEIKKILLVCMNQPDQLGHTPMHTLALHGSLKENIEVVKYAASICENPNPQDDFGSTPMHIAAELGYLEFVKALIPYWNNKHLLNHDNKTAFMIAKEKGHREIVKLMNSVWEIIDFTGCSVNDQLI